MDKESYFKPGFVPKCRDVDLFVITSQEVQPVWSSWRSEPGLQCSAGAARGDTFIFYSGPWQKPSYR